VRSQNPTILTTSEFYSEPVHVRQWVAFVRRIGEAALANDFSRVVSGLAQFLMPAAKAAATSADYPVRWEPLGVRGSADSAIRSSIGYAVASDYMPDDIMRAALELLTRLEYLMLYRNGGESRWNSCHACGRRGWGP
jgi:hypothetical protein